MPFSPYTEIADAMRRRYGTLFTLDRNGVAYAANSKPLALREHEYVPEGANNVANPDLRWFNVAQNCPALVGDTGVWSANGRRYTVIAIHPSVIGGETVAQRLAAYLTPVDSPSGSDDPQAGTWQAAQQD